MLGFDNCKLFFDFIRNFIISLSVFFSGFYIEKIIFSTDERKVVYSELFYEIRDDVIFESNHFLIESIRDNALLYILGYKENRNFTPPSISGMKELQDAVKNIEMFRLLKIGFYSDLRNLANFIQISAVLMLIYNAISYGMFPRPALNKNKSKNIYYYLLILRRIFLTAIFTVGSLVALFLVVEIRDRSFFENKGSIAELREFSDRLGRNDYTGFQSVFDSRGFMDSLRWPASDPSTN